MRVYFLKVGDEMPMFNTITRSKSEIMKKAGTKAMKAKGAVPYAGRLNTGKRYLESYDILGFVKKSGRNVDETSFIEKSSPLLFRDTRAYVAASMTIGEPLS